MNITRDNYEVFFLDYLEGNLEENRIDQFLDFLEQNPDLKEELQLFENVSLPEEKLQFSDKNRLYKSSLYEKELLENKFIAYLENDLEQKDRKLFESWLEANPEFQKEFILYTKARLVPEPGIVFQDKNTLYRKSGKAIVLKWIARVAAVVVLLWGISTVFQMQNQTSHLSNTPELAKINPSVEKTETTPLPVGKNNPVVMAKNQEIASPQRVVQPIIQKKSGMEMAEAKSTGSPVIQERVVQPISEIQPILATLEYKTEDVQLAIDFATKTKGITTEPDVLTLDEYLALRAKKVGNEGLLSAQRILRTGLGIASEISGDRIGYAVKDGKISSLEFESKLLAFSIPLERNK